MGQKMAYLENAVLAHTLGLATYTPPTTLYFVASTALFDPTLDGSTVVEPTDGSYSRPSMPNNNTFWASVSGSNPASSSNLQAVAFPTAGVDWGVVQAVYVGDASTAGNLLWGTAVPGGGVTITTLSTFQIAVGALVIRET